MHGLDCISCQGYYQVVQDRISGLTNDSGLDNGVDFKWIDTTQVEFTNWAKNEPNNVDYGEGCTEMYSNGYWNDSPCDKEHSGFICKSTRPTQVSYYRGHVTYSVIVLQ